MKIRQILLSLVLGVASPLLADIIVTLPQNFNQSSIAYYYAPIKQYAYAKTRADRGVVADSVPVVDSKAVIKIPSDSQGYLYGINLDENNLPVYASSGETVNLNVLSLNPFEYSLSGSDLADGMNELKLLEDPVMTQAYELNASGNPDPDKMQALGQEFVNIQKEFIKANPEGAAVPIALMNLDGQDFIEIYESLPASINNSILFPIIETQYEREKNNIEMEKKQRAMSNGETMAPEFTLKNLEGENVSLSDFRGKWVILDFWGSWCPWCIKGFPELKEAYQKYSGKLEIIGIDCRESEAEWRAGVEKYELPWVNLYNPEGSDLLKEYGVQGFPTKAIINPEGKIANITVGHDPAFFEVLSNLIQQ